MPGRGWAAAMAPLCLNLIEHAQAARTRWLARQRAPAGLALPPRPHIRRAESTRRQTPGRERREVDVPCGTVKDQLAHRLAGRGRVEHAPDAVAGRHVGTVDTR